MQWTSHHREFVLRPLYFDLLSMYTTCLHRDDDMPTIRRHQEERISEDGGVVNEEEGVVNEEGVAEEEAPRIYVEIPRCVAQINSDLHFVKLPNFLSVETRCVCV